MGIVTVGLLGGAGEPALGQCDHVLLVPDSGDGAHPGMPHRARPRGAGTAGGSAWGLDSGDGDPGHRRGRVHRLPRRRALLARGEHGDRRRQPQRLLRCAAEAGAAGAAGRAPGFTFHRADVADREALPRLVGDGIATSPRIVHLAAQAGVRYSLVDPYAYVQSNVMGHLVMLEAARRLAGLRHLVYASSSSVYGANPRCRSRDRPGGHAAVAVCRDQAGRRTDEPRLWPSVRAAADRVAVLHGLRAVGPAGHGLLQLRPGDHGGRADHGL